MKSQNAAVLSPTTTVRKQIDGPPGSRCQAVDFRTGADHIQSRRGVDYATGELLITLKATHRIGVQQAVAK